MPELLELVISLCIVGYVLRETVEDLQKKKADHDGQDHDKPEDSQG